VCNLVQLAGEGLNQAGDLLDGEGLEQVNKLLLQLSRLWPE